MALANPSDGLASRLIDALRVRKEPVASFTTRSLQSLPCLLWGTVLANVGEAPRRAPGRGVQVPRFWQRR